MMRLPTLLTLLCDCDCAAVRLRAQAMGPSRRLQQDNKTAPAPAEEPVVEAAPAFVPAYLDAATLDVADLLLQATDPGAGWASSGDNGVYVAVANQAGRSYQGLTTAALAVGPVADVSSSRSDASLRDNVVITFSGDLLGSCPDQDTGVVAPSDSCIVPTVTIYATDPAGAIDASAPKDASVPDGFEAVSGALTLKAGGADKGLLPCAIEGCTATLRFPVREAAVASKLYQCFQVVDGVVVLSGEAVASQASRAIDAGNTGDVPTFSCAVKQAGTYLVGKYPDPNYREGAAESPYASITGLVSFLVVVTRCALAGTAAYRAACMLWLTLAQRCAGKGVSCEACGAGCKRP